MNCGNGMRRTLAVHRIQRHSVGKSEDEPAVSGGKHAGHVLRRNRAWAIRANRLDVDAGLVTWLSSGEHDALAIGQEAGVAVIDRILSDLLRLTRAERNDKELAGQVQGKTSQHPLHVGREISAFTVANPHWRGANGGAYID